MRSYYVYILTNRSGTLYTGVTNNMERRLLEHRDADEKSFSGRYKTTRLVYVESTDNVDSAITREKQIKGWVRKRKIELIASMNPTWRDLGEELFDDGAWSLTQASGREVAG